MSWSMLLILESHLSAYPENLHFFQSQLLHACRVFRQNYNFLNSSSV